MKLTKDQMTSGYLTHELRAPLAAIRFALELFLDKNGAALGEQDAHILAIALRNTTKLNLLINDIMELSKIQTGQLGLFPAVTDPVKLVRDAAEDMSSWVQHANLTLKVSSPDKCPAVFVDQRRTAQSLTNLISNAIKFTPDGGSIEVTVEKGKAKQEGFVMVSVRDTGCGIAPENLNKVFGYFVQVGTQSNRGDGSGLGLSLARSMVEIQGGNMWVTSRPGEGSTFIFTMPVFSGQAPAPKNDTAATPAIYPGPAGSGPAALPAL